MSHGKNWCFTINNPSMECQDLLGKISSLPGVKYLVFQKEVGACGTSHIQGYLQLEAKKRLNWLKENVDGTAHFESARGSADSNRSYCTKQDTRVEGPFEHGVIKRSGDRNDLAKIRDVIKGNPTISVGELAEISPEVIAKYPRFISTLKKEYAKPKSKTFSPRAGWQFDLSEELLGRPDPRKVIWYWEATGNVGKSYFSLNYVDGSGRHGYVVTGGRHTDIFYGYNFEKVVFFDWTRDNQETVPYSVLESFKNGYFLNTKYESTPVRFETPHVVVFANYPPLMNKLSLDRWDIREINE